MGSSGRRGGLGIERGSPGRNRTMSSLPSNSLFYSGETSGAASDPMFCDDPDGRSDVVLFQGSVSLESLLVRVRSLEYKVCCDDMRGHPS